MEIAGLMEAKQLYAQRQYSAAIQAAEDDLPQQNNPRVQSEVHLLIAKCHKNLNDLKSAISSCNLAIEIYSKWKEPYLFRSACFQAFHSELQEGGGDPDEVIQQDRESADIVVDPNSQSTPVEEEDESSKMRQLFRKQERKQVVVNTLCEALRRVENGGTIFVEKGTYEISSKTSMDSSAYFLYGKSVSIYGANSAECILLYRCDEELVSDLEPSSKLETFLLASNSNVPVLIKRFTFRNENPAGVNTKFLGVAGGTVQLEDCILECGGSPGSVDGVYTNSRICGSFSADFPPPYLIVRFCVFDRCGGSSGVTCLNSCVNIKSSLFIGEEVGDNAGSKSSISAQSSSKVTIENCEFSLDRMTVTAVRSESSDLTMSGSYLHGLEVGEDSVEDESEAGGALHLLNSVAKIENNYFYRVELGAHAFKSDLTCSGNLFYSCSRRYSGFQRSSSSLPYSAILIRGPGKVQILENVIRRCDIGISISEKSNPALRTNVLDGIFFCGMLVDSRSKPIIAENTVIGGDPVSQVPSGVGVIFLTESAGVVGKNSFQDFLVSPILVFTHCHPLLKGNRFINVNIAEKRQAEIEQLLIQYYTTEVAEDSYFYLVDSTDKENSLASVILKGPPTPAS